MQIDAFLKGKAYKIEPIDPLTFTNIQVKLLELRSRTYNHLKLSDEKRDEIYTHIKKCHTILDDCQKDTRENSKQFVHNKIEIIEEVIDEIQKELNSN